MIDLEELRKRTEAARQQALQSLHSMEEQTETLAGQAAVKTPSETDRDEETACREAEQDAANARRQVEILGQVFDTEAMAQMAAGQDIFRQMVEEKAAEAASANVQELMGQLFGEDMGVIMAAMETLAMEDPDEEDPDGTVFGPEQESELYALLDDTMARLEALPEPAPVPYAKESARWNTFGILLSGLISTLNTHHLDRLDVEDHIPVMEQQIVSLVRRSWGIDGRSDLLEMLRYLFQQGYELRYQYFCEADSPDSLLDEDADEEDRESTARAWRFAQFYKDRFGPVFMAGWDIGRAAMLTRWGSYLGWITESEAIGFLWELSHKAAEDLHSWREFAQSYLFGGLMWKLLGDPASAASYLGQLADAASVLLTGRADGSGGEWKTCPWPERRRIGFSAE